MLGRDTQIPRNWQLDFFFWVCVALCYIILLHCGHILYVLSTTLHAEGLVQAGAGQGRGSRMFSIVPWKAHPLPPVVPWRSDPFHTLLLKGSHELGRAGSASVPGLWGSGGDLRVPGGVAAHPRGGSTTRGSSHGQLCLLPTNEP